MKISLRGYILVSVLAFVLPLLLIIPNWHSSFFGSDFIFPYNRINDVGYPLRLWSSDYLGDRNFAAYGIPVLLLAKLSYVLGGSLHAPHVFIYIILASYLFSVGLLVKCVREVILSSKQDALNDYSFLYDGLLVAFAFISPVLLGYFANYFTVGILLATVGVILSLRSLLKFVLNGEKKTLSYCILWTLAIVHPPTFFFYVGIATLLLIAKSKRDAIIFLATTLTLNAFWLIPLAFSFLSPDVVSLSADASYIDHIFNWYGKSSNIIINSLFSIHPNNKLFRVIPVQIYALAYFIAYIVIFYALLSPLKSINKTIRRAILSLAGALLVTLAFSFGGKYETGVIFSFLWTHVSALHFFKSFTQILNVGFILFIALLSASFAMIEARRVKVVCASILAISSLLVLAFYFQPLNRYIARGVIPEEYRTLQKTINQDPAEFRVLNLPEINYEFYAWNYDWDQHVITQKWFDKPVVSFGIVAPSIARNIYPLNSDYTTLFKENNFKYLLVHRDYASKNFKAKDFTFDYSLVDLVDRNQYFDLYKLKDPYFTPRLSSVSASSFRRVDSLRYQVQLSNIATSTQLTFLEKFDPGWRLAPASGSVSCESRNGVSDFLKMVFRAPLSDESHKLAQGYASQWTIYSEDVVKGYSNEYYDRNQDGTIDVCLTIYFRPQIYLYISIFITLLSLVGIVAYGVLPRRSAQNIKYE